MPDHDAPGLKRRPRADGSIAYYWVAASIDRKASDYPLRTMRLEGTDAEIAARCRILTGELREWLVEMGRGGPPAFDGTIASLIDNYQCDEDSPFRAVKSNTRRHYEQTLAIIYESIGHARIAVLTRKDFARWYRGFRFPDGETGPERLRRAHNCMKLLRIVTRFGASMRFAGCRDASMILADMDFTLPAPRREQLSFEQASAIVDRALGSGRPSIALAQAMQFELSLRQKDVIGEWEKAEPGAQGIVSHGWRWSGGILWSDLSENLVLVKQTTKTAAIGEWRLPAYPLVMKALQAFTGERRRAGPMVVSESTGLPYRADDYRIKWRALATEVGVPAAIWNMDSRAGGITDGADAGAQISDLQRHATHADSKMTSRYVRGTLASTDRVAELRAARRKRDEK